MTLLTPNWREAPEVRYSYRTDIITSRSGKEQRRALRLVPRRQITFTVTVDNELRRDLSRLLASQQGKLIDATDPTRKVALAADCASGATALTVDEVPAWIAAGERIAIAGQTVTVVSAAVGGAVTVTPGLAAARIAGTSVRPVLSSRILGATSMSHPVNRVAEARITFDVEAGENVTDTEDAGVHVLDGREIFTFRPTWGEAVEQNFEWPVEQIDYGQYRTATFQPLEYGWMTQSATFLGIGRGRMGDIEAFFHRQHGRRGEFLMPTGTDDMTPVTDLTTGSFELRVVGTAIYDTFADDTRFRAILVRTNDGRLMPRSISAMAVVAGNTVLTLNTAWLVDISIAEIATVSWLHVARFASDDLTVEWPTDEAAQVKLGMLTLPTFTAEFPLTDLDEAARWLLETGQDGYLFEDLDWLVNVVAPAVFWWPLPWVMIHETVIDSFDHLVNISIPETTS